MSDLLQGIPEIPERLNIADRIVSHHVREGRGDAPALTCGGRTLTYAELEEHMNRAGNVLGELGAVFGDRVIVHARNSLDHVALILGAMKIGAVPISSNTLFRAKEMAAILKNSDASVLVVDEELREPVDEAAPGISTLKQLVTLPDFVERMERASSGLETADTRADDVAYTTYTSGSTGEPKGVEHGHRTIIAAGHPVVEHLLKLEPTDNVLVPIELSSLITFDFSVLWPLSVGAQGTLLPTRFNPDGFLAAVARDRCTVVMSVPTMWRVLLAQEDLEEHCDFSSVRYALCGGEALPEDTYNAIKSRFGFEIYEMIGSTEAHPYIANPVGRPPKVGSLGVPLPGREATIRSDEGEELPAGEIGHLCLRSDDPAVALGYRKRQAEWGEMHRDGWFYTGDLAQRDEDGYFWFVSRADDVIMSRAYRISPAEVENATMEHPAVLQSGVIGVPDEMIGERIRAYVVLKPGVEPSEDLAEEIRQFVRQLIAPYKTPKEIEFVAASDLPTTMSGKIQRGVLRERVKAQAAAS